MSYCSRGHDHESSCHDHESSCHRGFIHRVRFTRRKLFPNFTLVKNSPHCGHQREQGPGQCAAWGRLRRILSCASGDRKNNNATIPLPYQFTYSVEIERDLLVQYSLCSLLYCQRMAKSLLQPKLPMTRFSGI